MLFNIPPTTDKEIARALVQEITGKLYGIIEQCSTGVYPADEWQEVQALQTNLFEKLFQLRQDAING